MNISTTDAQGLYTKMVADVYKERSKTTSFLRSFFPDKVVPTLEVSIEVSRGFEKIAVDVSRGTDGNRNQWSKSTEKIFIPPYFREYFDSTQLQLYDRLYGATEISDALFAAFINDVVDHQMELQDKIERAYELQCSQVLETGIVTLNQGINIDYKRKAGSLVDLNGAGGYWATNNDVFAQLQAGCTWLRKNGKTQGFVFNCILGDEAMEDFMANTKVLARQNLFNMKLDTLSIPQKNSLGGVYHGTVTAGPYQVNLWTYPEYYDTAAGVSTPYFPSKKGVILPMSPRFKMAFAAVPQLIEPGRAPLVGAYIFSDYIDRKNKTHEYHVESAGVPIPVAVDQIYTFQAVAS